MFVWLCIYVEVNFCLSGVMMINGVKLSLSGKRYHSPILAKVTVNIHSHLYTAKLNAQHMMSQEDAF